MTDTELNRIKLHALTDSITYPPYKEETVNLVIKSSGFNLETIITEIPEMPINKNTSMSLDMIMGILKIVDNNKDIYFTNDVGSVILHWVGLPIIKIIMSDDYKKLRVMSISLKSYRDELNERLSQEKVKKILKYSVGTILVVGIGYFLAKKIMD